MSDIPRIAVDFNTMMTDDRSRVLINTTAYPVEALHLQNRALVVLYDDEMEVDAFIEYDEQHDIWFGCPDWNTRRDI